MNECFTQIWNRTGSGPFILFISIPKWRGLCLCMCVSMIYVCVRVFVYDDNPNQPIRKLNVINFISLSFRFNINYAMLSSKSVPYSQTEKIHSVQKKSQEDIAMMGKKKNACTFINSNIDIGQIVYLFFSWPAICWIFTYKKRKEIKNLEKNIGNKSECLFALIIFWCAFMTHAL